MVTRLQQYYPQVACLSQETNTKMKLIFTTSMFPCHCSSGCSESYRAAAHYSSGGKSGSVFRVFASKRDLRSPSPHTMAPARAPMELIPIDTAGPYQESLGRSWYVIMFADSASRFQRPYGTRDTNEPAILAIVKRFVVEMVVPGAFRMDNGPEYTNRTFTEYCDGLRIRRELTAP